ncbi:MAG: transcriptional regulator [Acidobacteria bacterium]|nr:transcriptional regulator [Acidobacteriota bacterium]
MPTKKVSPGITRFDLDDKRMHGYRVRIARQKQIHLKFFSDKKSGGKRKAFQLAKAYYQELLATLPASAAGKNKMKPSNKTGQVGVHLAQDRSTRWPNSSTQRYVASWIDSDGYRKTIGFNLEKYGAELAWEYACLARTKEIEDRQQVLKLYEKTKGKEKRKNL